MLVVDVVVLYVVVVCVFGLNYLVDVEVLWWCVIDVMLVFEFFYDGFYVLLML